MAAKFKLKPVADFKLPVTFNMPNGEEAKVIFTVAHRKSKDVTELFEGPIEDRVNDLAFLKEFAKGWDLDEEFNDENLQEAIDFFPGMVISFSYEYIRALAGNRTKN